MRFKSTPRKGHFMPELVASGDISRPVLTTVHLNVETSAIEVTDSYMLARFPVELDEGDTSGPIPVEALKASRKPPIKLRDAGTSIRANSHVEVRMAFGDEASEPYVTLPRESSEYRFPNIDQLLPDNLSEFEIGLDASKLAKLAKAMGSDVVRLRFTQGRAVLGQDEPTYAPSNLRPIVVYPGNLSADDENSPRGLLMPVRLS